MIQFTEMRKTLEGHCLGELICYLQMLDISVLSTHKFEKKKLHLLLFRLLCQFRHVEKFSYTQRLLKNSTEIWPNTCSSRSREKLIIIMSHDF